MSGPGSGSPLVDWGLAERVAVTIAGAGTAQDAIGQDEVDRAAGLAVTQVADYTGLEPQEELPRAEAVDRPEWVRANLATFREMSGDLEGRLADSLRMPEPLRGLVETLTGTVGGAEVGLALGYVARKVLGQYDVGLIGPMRPPRLLFVAPNLGEAQRRLEGDRELFLHWIALHEATHALQFASVPWLREHLGGVVEELLRGASLEGDLSELRSALRRLLPPPGPRRLAEHLREGGLVRLLAAPDRVRLLRRLQAAMALIEGYSEHVMDAIGAGLDPDYARLRRAVEAERERRGALDAIVARLLGLDLKLRQYRVGKRFADSVVEQSGIEGLNEVWRAPDALPEPDELESPNRWVARAGIA